VSPAVLDDGLRAEVLAVLRRGLGRVRTHWAAGPQIPRDRVCIIEALFIDPLTGQTDDSSANVTDLATFRLRDTAGVPSAGRLMEWNDAQTSNAPVVALYQRAIAALEQEAT
jgi:hypothetical protein